MMTYSTFPLRLEFQKIIRINFRSFISVAFLSGAIIFLSLAYISGDINLSKTLIFGLSFISGLCAYHSASAIGTSLDFLDRLQNEVPHSPDITSHLFNNDVTERFREKSA